MLDRLALASLALALLVGASACEKNQQEPSEPEVSGGGPEVIVEEPGAEPAEPEVPAEPEAPAEPEPGGEDPPGGTKIVKTKVPCQTDADCVKDSCCHPTSCVAPANAPNCGQTMCTMDCRAGTMDCYGGCLCQDGVCAAQIWVGGAPTP